MGAMPSLAYAEDETSLEKEDCLFIFTDGVTEAMDPEGQLFSEARLESFLGSADRSSAQSLTGSVLQSVEKFAAEADQFDDITILVYRLQEAPTIIERSSLEVSIAADITEIARVQQATEKFTGETNIDTGAAQKIGIILDELLNNTISYGFDDPKSHEIQVNIELSDDHATLKVSDDGIPFNPFTHSDPDTSLSVEEREIGGLGVMLVKKLTDSQAYQRLSDRNVVTLTIKLKPD
jgi:sigma-B regulation protein RsbU (phosphoserine phosphatase)